MNKISIFLIIFLIFVNVGSVVILHASLYTSKNYWQRYPQLEKQFYNSIYKNKHGKFIPDELIYAYVGGALIKGGNPILLNPEVPPLGKYLIGISILIFNNENIISLFSGVSVLILLFLLGKQIFSSTIQALIPPLLFSFEPIFKNQLIYTPLLDIIQLVFLLGIFYVFNAARVTGKRQKMYFVLIGILLGFFIATKFFATGIAVIGAMVLALLNRKDVKRLLLVIVSVFVAISVLYGSYFQLLIRGYPFNRFLGIQKWVWLYNSGHLSQPFTVWPLLFLNKWYLWFGSAKVTTDTQWTLSWPIITSLSCVASAFGIIYRTSKSVDIIIFWIICYLGMLSFVQISSRYFVILIPFFYILVTYLIGKIIYFVKKQVQ